MSAPKKNKFAAKPVPDRADDNLNFRVRKTDKARWKKAAKLRAKRDPRMTGEQTQWVVDVLNAEADYEEGQK
jgi:hypothetical protein